MPNRRDFLKQGAVAGTGALLARGGVEKAFARGIDAQQIGNAYTLYAAATPPLTKWTMPLISSIPVAALAPTQPYAGADYYEIRMEGGRWQFHTLLPVAPTAKKFTTWGYGSSNFFIGYLGPTIEAKKDIPVVVKFTNLLPDFHPVQQALDPTVPEPEIYGVMPGGRVTPHLHGGFTAPQFDGHPHSWWTSGNNGAHPIEHGTHYHSLAGAAPNEAIFYYCNKQPATMLWYHDHAMGQTRVNAYVGLAALYFIRDNYDTGQVFGTPGLPATALNLPAGQYEVPLVLQDKTFNLDGSLFYPILGVTPEHPIWMPEFFGDTPVINGQCYPFMNVEARRYRFRIVNGSQARFYNLWIPQPNKGNLPMYQIGAEEGLLPAPYLLPGGQLLIAPGERADVIVDFTGLPVGTIMNMKNNAKVPYPGGGGGPSIPELMQFRVIAPPAGSIPDATTPAASLVLQPVTPLVVTNPTPREIVMKETLGPTTAGNQMAPTHVRLNERWFDEVAANNVDLVIDESPSPDAVEEWVFVNLTVDAHPMHMHLVAFQVVNRQAFDAAGYTTAYMAWVNPVPPAIPRDPATKPVLANFLLGAPILPLGDEKGWKDTVKVYPGQVARVRMQFAVPDEPGTPGASTLAGTNTILPAQYVFHCHILEHEENEMMRPFVVKDRGGNMGTHPRGLWKPGVKATASLPTEFALEQNYPNPFNPETTLRFNLPENSHVELKIYSGLGQEIATLADADYAAGTHAVKWNAAGFASGTYFARIKAGKFAAMQKMQLVK
jgi:spore coat protein A, manganese oxidase